MLLRISLSTLPRTLFISLAVTVVSCCWCCCWLQPSTNHSSTICMSHQPCTKSRNYKVLKKTGIRCSIIIQRSKIYEKIMCIIFRKCETNTLRLEWCDRDLETTNKEDSCIEHRHHPSVINNNNNNNLINKQIKYLISIVRSCQFYYAKLLRKPDEIWKSNSNCRLSFLAQAKHRNL